MTTCPSQRASMMDDDADGAITSATSALPSLPRTASGTGGDLHDAGFLRNFEHQHDIARAPINVMAGMLGDGGEALVTDDELEIEVAADTGAGAHCAYP